MRAAFDDAAMVEHHDHVGIAHGGQAVCDHEHGTTLHEVIHTGLHHFLGTGVDGRSGLVEDHGRRIGHGRTSDGDQLTLALRQTRTITFEHGLIAVWQHADEAVGVRKLRSGNAFLVGGVEPTVTDVVHHRACEQVHVLQHHTQRTTQIRLADALDGNAVVQNHAVLNVIETVDQVSHRGLTGTRGTDQCDLLPGLGEPSDVMQHRLVGVVAEGHVGEAHIALQQGKASIRRSDGGFTGLHRYFCSTRAQGLRGLE